MSSRRFVAGIVGWFGVTALSLLPQSSKAQAPRVATRTQVVLLGTGTPLPDPERAGPSVAIVVNGTAYIVDAGVGLVRRAAAMAKTVDALRPVKLRIAFLTHLHSDHTLGLPDLLNALRRSAAILGSRLIRRRARIVGTPGGRL